MNLQISVVSCYLCCRLKTAQFRTKMNQTSADHNSVKSTAVVKYSASQSPATFAQLQCNTDLNLPPANWLSSSASVYGLQHVLSQSTGFSSFRMAHMFPDCVGEVDVVSDAENIKNLLKLPYSRGQVSMMVHRIENTLLIDEFDIYKHLLKTAEKEWEWLRKFFYDHVRQSFSEKDRNLYLQNKSRNALQQKSLVSKFLYHSLVESSDDSSSYESQNAKPESFPVSGPALPEPNLEEEVPDPTTNHKYNRNVVWTFEDIQMLIGTDMPIFGGTTHPCISLRLRDMGSPINVLTGIDYWLDNLMSNVPEVVMCYHLNGIVQKYELIKTEDLPNMENSKFSPAVIRDIAQNILSFLKSNATKAGHTYWLFKSKDDDVVKLYDLTSLCAEEKDDSDQNPFTVPVAMLLYRVARNMKHTSGRKQPGTIRMLLKNCIELLEKEKYPQIVTSSHFMISDLYVPANTDPAAPGLEHMETDDMESCYEDDLNETEGDDTAMKQLRLGKDKADGRFVYKPPPPISGTLDERCQHALSHVIGGLECLQYFPSHDEDAEELKKKVEQARKREEEDNPTMAKPFQAIPMPYAKLNDDTQTKIKSDKKSKKRSKNSRKLEMTESVSDALLLKPTAEAIPTWQEPDRSDNASWNVHLKTLLYEKACLVFAILAEQDYVLENYGSSIRNIDLLIRCHQVLNSLKYSSRAVQESCLLGRAGDSCFMMVKHWDKVDKYREQFNQTLEIQAKILEQIDKEDLLKDSEKVSALPQVFDTIEQMLLASCKCYEKALLSDPVQELKALYRRLGNVQNELGVFYMNKAGEDSDRFQENYKRALTFLQNGIKSFEEVRDDANLALLYSNMGRLMRLCAHFYSPNSASEHKLKGQEKHFYNKALESYQKALYVIGNRRNNPIIWDTVTWELSSALFIRATILQDFPSSTQVCVIFGKN